MRESILQCAYRPRVSRWIDANGMRMPDAFANQANRDSILLADLSHLRRVGLKGLGAADWLRMQHVPVPGRVNAWRALPDGGLIARLGESEFLLEDGPVGSTAAAIGNALGAGTPGVYPVLRQDAALVLWGARANEALLETCSVDFASIDCAQHTLVMTTMVGVSVLVVLRRTAGTPILRVWTDPTFGPYLWNTLCAIVEGLGGAPAGLASCVPPLMSWTD